MELRYFEKELFWQKCFLWKFQNNFQSWNGSLLKNKLFCLFGVGTIFLSSKQLFCFRSWIQWHLKRKLFAAESWNYLGHAC